MIIAGISFFRMYVISVISTIFSRMDLMIMAGVLPWITVAPDTMRVVWILMAESWSQTKEALTACLSRNTFEEFETFASVWMQ